MPDGSPQESVEGAAEALEVVLNRWEERFLKAMHRAVEETSPGIRQLLTLVAEAEKVMLDTGLVIDVSKCSEQTRAEIRRLIEEDAARAGRDE